MSSEENCRHKVELHGVAQVFKAQKAHIGQTHYIGESDLELLTLHKNRQGTTSGFGPQRLSRDSDF